MKRCSVYIHIPFCVKKCAYCDFVSYPGTAADRMAQYVQAVSEEISAFAAREKRIAESVFFGGGTPTVLAAEALGALLDAVRRSFDIAEDAEITCEANPGTADEAYLRTLRGYGFNRLSLGVQSCEPHLLCMLGRIHTAEQAAETVLAAQRAGFADISVDLMYALPGQTEADWQHTLETVCAWPVTHLSCYSLIVEDGTPLKAKIESGELTLPDEDAALRMHRMTLPMLQKHGFKRYEISNYERGGHPSRHNRVYWLGGDYAGFGCAAHSLIDGCRYRNADSLSAYLSGERGIDRIVLTATDRLEEALMLETRTAEGIDLTDFAMRFGDALEVRCSRGIAYFQKAGAIRLEQGRLLLTERGFEVHSHIAERLIEEWEGLM